MERGKVFINLNNEFSVSTKLRVYRPLKCLKVHQI